MPLIAFIPETYKDGFIKISSLSEETFSAMREALNSVPITSSISDLIARVVSSNPSLKEEVIEPIFSSIEALIPLIEDEEQIEESVSDVAGMIDVKDATVFKERLLFLIKSNKIFYTSKANDLITETENVFLTGRVITDMRPLFGLNTTEPPKAGLIVHNLHIHYQGAMTNTHQDIYLSLNSTDVENLMRALIRAGEKESSLKALMESMHVECIND